MSTQNTQFVFEAIGTRWIIDIDSASLEPTETELKQLVLERIEEFDKNYSRFRDDSLVSEMAKQAGAYRLPDDAQPMMGLYQKLYKLTDGLFTPLIGRTLEQAGYGKNYSLEPGQIDQSPAWDVALNYQFPNIEIKQPITLDFGAAGKGYLVDIVGQLLREQGITAFTIDAGGDILYQNQDSQFLEVALEDSDNASKAIGIVKILNQSLAGSAGNRRKWKNFHHIINPKTLRPANDVAAVWVMAETAMLADALATCLFLNPHSHLQDHFKFEYLIMYPNRSVKYSRGFPVNLFLDGK